MSWKHFISKIRYYGQYFPFTLNSALCAVAAWWAFQVLYTPVPKGENPSAFLPVILLMGRLTILFLVSLASLSVLSAFYCFAYYLYLKSAKNAVLKVAFQTETKTGKKNKLFLNTQVDGVIRPLLGFVKGRIFYDDYRMTDQFSMLTDKRAENGFWRTGISGKSRLLLPDIKEYDIKGGFIYFQDMLHLISLAIEQPVNGHFYHRPVAAQQDDAEAAPKQTENLDIRIDQMRRVDGEYLNYKDFEAGDDVRRIVWKVYARNRELVVRMPERYEPFASHLYFYASFYRSGKPSGWNNGYVLEMLNYYKNKVWTIYEALAKKEWEINYVPDQLFSFSEDTEKSEHDARIIANSTWHTEKEIAGYFNTKLGSALCISSFADPADLANTLEKCDAATMLYFIPLSAAFRTLVPLGIVTRIVLRPPQDRLSRLKDTWIFAPLRLEMLKREQNIRKILEVSNVMWAEV
jgi:Protein of unknown function DUF58